MLYRKHSGATALRDDRRCARRSVFDTALTLSGLIRGVSFGEFVLKRQMAAYMCNSHQAQCIIRVVMDAKIQLVMLDVPSKIAALAIFTNELTRGAQLGIVVNA